MEFEAPPLIQEETERLGEDSQTPQLQREGQVLYVPRPVSVVLDVESYTAMRYHGQ